MGRETRIVVVGSKIGLHARPASIFVQAVNETGHKVWLKKSDDEMADARSILSVLGLGAAHGVTLTLEVEGDNASEVADQLAALVESDLDAT